MTRTLGTMTVLLTMLRHADRVRIGCATGGLGNLCMTDREHVWKGACHYPFTQLIRYAVGSSLMPVVECEKYDVDGYVIDDMNQYAGFEGVDYIQAAAAVNEAENEMTVFVINADWEDREEFTLDVRGFEGWKFAGHTWMYSDDEEAHNSFEHPDVLLPKPNPDAKCEKGVVSAVLPKLSWNVFRFTKD
jgi:alpha-N-arabinofuranosidase